ncbi:hypothetical protein BTM25_24260 [Actinomadura rubteroloni]|uniref:Uncharacterized protein n=1 Tax=Actinomadura rubteroloni TaxID=1926885 RepID=A0A2P4UFG5_9ACTN|nr:hypothetical protein [Actinomadura rubteroloni]POM23800.1 hypothetical protein BTM25_24260 [Actinomadura rubteroloni]
MTEQPAGGEVRTIAIRVPPAFKQQLDSVVALTDLTLNDAGIEALHAWIAAKLADPKLREKARADLVKRKEAFEAEAKALEGLIGEGEPAPEKPSTTRSRGKTSGGNAE